MKYSFILPVNNRSHLLSLGLESIASLNYSKNEYEVIIVDHMSDDGIEKVIKSFVEKINIRHVIIDINLYPREINIINGRFCNPALAQNVGGRFATGQFLILTSPEIIHHSENLVNLDLIDNLNNKFIYGRVLQKKEEEVFKDGQCDFSKIEKFVPNSYSEILCDWEKKGISISVYFIGIISKSLFYNLGGIDEKFMAGIAFEDDDFGNRIIAHSDITSEYKKNIFGIHLEHSREYLGSTSFAENEKLKINKIYLDSKENIGWEKLIVANKELKEFGTLEVVKNINDYKIHNYTASFW